MSPIRTKVYVPFTKTIVCLSTVLFAVSTMANELSQHPGYVSNVEEERNQVREEVVITPLPNRIETDWSRDIFTEKMSKEFSHEFRYRFGFTEFEQLEFTSNRFVESSDSGRLVPVNEFIEEQEDFGEFMIKELSEYHVDRYLRSRESTRVIYRTKEAISNVEVATASGYKFKMRYKLSSNRATFRFIKPGQRFHNELVTKLSGDETTLRFSYDLTKTIVVGTDYIFDDEIFAVRGSKQLTPKLSTSIVAQSYQKDLSAETPKQERILLGLSWFD